MEESIYDFMYEKCKITKPIRLIELFSGYGSQALALKYLNVNFEHWRTCEWAVKSIQAYKDIHMTNDNEDYSNNLTKEELIEYLTKKGISSNYNEPMKYEQIKRLSEDKLRTIYNNIIATHNLVNIQQAKGKDLNIKDTKDYTYLLTYSFPCQDLSNAGLKKGFSDTSTRSGMLWEVERLLDECKEIGELPQILLMENVIQVHSLGDNMKNFQKWQNKLEDLGYKNYWQDLIATDYEIPQTRNRTFMVSILGDYSYTFPKPVPLKLKLKDLLEENVDKKYYLSDKMIDYMYGVNSHNEFNRKEIFERNLKKTNKENVASTVTTLAGNRATDNFIIDTENYIEWKEKGKLDSDCRAYKEDKVSGTIMTTPKNKILIKNATKQGYLEANEGDGINISSRMEQQRGNVQKDKIQTITTSGGEDRGVVTNNLRIRKLIPKECFRLMGVKDEDYENCAKNQSDSSLYHLAGDSIVVNVLMAIIKQLI